MTTPVRFALAAVCGIVLSIHAAQLAAQPPQQPPPGAGHPGQAPAAAGGGDSSFSGKGTIQEISGVKGEHWITMTSAENQTWKLHCSKTTKVKVVGTALPEYLKAGMHIRFSAVADKKAGKLKEEKVAKLTVIPATEAGAGFVVDPEAKDAASEGDFKSYVVSGTISTVHGKTITLTVPASPKLKFELDDSPQIDFEMVGIALAKTGDSIEAQGTKVVMPQVPQQRPQQMQRRPMMGGMYGRQGMGQGMGPGMQQPGGPGQPGAPPGGGLDSTTPMVANLIKATITKTEPLGGTVKKTSSKLSAKAHGKLDKEKDDTPFGTPPAAAAK
jgi:hypothetical protein